MNALSLYVLCVLSVAYIVRVLLFDGSTGPFESKHTWIVDGVGDGAYADPVDLWDRVRYLFGAYRVEDLKDGTKVWHTTERLDVWRCPKCLSFWVAFLGSAPFIFLTGYWVYFLLIHVSMVFCVQFLVFVQLWFEGD